jgi:general secretion pathway protein J
MRKLRGFTLVELLVALVIMALLALLSWRGLDGMTRVQSQTQANTDGVLALQAGLSQWQTDLDAISLQANVVGVTGLEYDGQVLRLTRQYAETSSNGTNTDSIRVVAWAQRTTETATGTGKVWLRWQSEPLNTRVELQAAWQQAAAWAKEGNEADKKREVSVAKITDWQVLVYQNGAWSNTLANFNAAANAGLNPRAVPDGLRLVLSLADGEALVGNITRDWINPALR